FCPHSRSSLFPYTTLFRSNRKMGFIFQGYFLLPELTALENVSMPGMIGGKSTRERAEESLVAVGLADRMQHLPAELSGGEQQRVDRKSTRLNSSHGSISYA